MKFKVGDLVRGNRDCFIAVINGEIEECEYAEKGFEIFMSEGGISFYGREAGDYLPDKYLELVPEEPEFEYGEEIEVRDFEHDERKETIFLHKLPGKAKYKYICAGGVLKDGEYYDTCFRRYARKLKPKLTRKEIAEKFGIDEDFIFVD